MKTLEQRLKEAVISFTDKFLYCNGSKTKYLDFYHWTFRKGGTQDKNDTLYVPVKGKTYKEIAENIYAGLMGEKKSVWMMTMKERRLLYQTYNKSEKYIKQLRRNPND